MESEAVPPGGLQRGDGRSRLPGERLGGLGRSGAVFVKRSMARFSGHSSCFCGVSNRTLFPVESNEMAEPVTEKRPGHLVQALMTNDGLTPNTNIDGRLHGPSSVPRAPSPRQSQTTEDARET